MNFSLIKFILFLFSLTFCSHLHGSVYFTNKILSPHNVSLSVGVPVLLPPHSFSNSFAKNILFNWDYRRETFFVPIIMRTHIETARQGQFQSAGIFSGIRLPPTNRKTPFYFGVLLGAGFSKNKKNRWPLSFQIFSSYRLYQFNKRVSTLIDVNVQYNLNKNAWWKTPSSIALFTTLDVNI